MRTAHFRGALTEKRGFRWRNITLYWGAASRCLRCGFPLVLRQDIRKRASVSRKTSPLSAAARAARKAVALPKVCSPKSVVFGGKILHLSGCSVMLPLLPRFYHTVFGCSVTHCRSRKARFSVAGYYTYPSAASRCLRCGFPLVLRQDIRKRASVSRKTSPLSAAAGAARKAVALPKVTLGKSAILPRFYYTLSCKHCEEIS